MKKRLSYIDQLRGIAILLVVMGHFIQVNTLESANSPLFSWIYAFHMPLFMFISGYVAFKTVRIDSVIDFAEFIKKRSITLLIPYFFWPLVVNCFFFKKVPLKYNFLKDIEALTHWSPLWFLWFLFFLMLFYAVFHIVSNWTNRKRLFIIDIAIAGSLLLILLLMKIFHLYFPIDIDSFLLYFIFFFLGVFISKFDFISKLLLNGYCFTFFLILFILFSGRYDFFDVGIQNKLVKMIISISAIASLYYIVIKIEWNDMVDKYIQLWGRNTIVIYTTHFVIIKLFIGVPLLHNLGLLPLIILSILFAFTIISACLLILKIVELCPPLDLLLYGHKQALVKVDKLHHKEH